MREMALHLLDLARNAIEAGATAMSLSVTENEAADRLEFAVEDNGKGMDDKALARATDAFFTTRSTRRFGLGLPLLRATCERCGGRLDIRSKPGEGTVVRGEMHLNHVDRPPLGDMGAVIQALACDAGQTALRYCHRADGEQFELDTAALQKELGEVPLSDPRVLCWLAQFVNDHIRDIGSRA
jgi:anti-sigma regulatory factor (Ser/Thr protein kinase)